jgi:hypothetical protein
MDFLGAGVADQAFSIFKVGLIIDPPLGLKLKGLLDFVFGLAKGFKVLLKLIFSFSILGSTYIRVPLLFKFTVFWICSMGFFKL